MPIFPHVTPLTALSHRIAEDTVRFRGPLGEVLSPDSAKDVKIGQCLLGLVTVLYGQR